MRNCKKKTVTMLHFPGRTQKVRQYSLATRRGVADDGVDVAPKRFLANLILSAVMGFYVGHVDHFASRIQRQRHRVNVISEERPQFAGVRLQLVDVLLAIISY